MIKTTLKLNKTNEPLEFPRMMRVKADGRIMLFTSPTVGIVVYNPKNIGSQPLYTTYDGWTNSIDGIWEPFNGELVLKNA
jgi:hypothetical protein